MTKQLEGRRRNYLKKVLEVQAFYQSVRVEGVPDIFIWRKHIYPRYPLSLYTFRAHLNLNAKKLLKEMDGE